MKKHSAYSYRIKFRVFPFKLDDKWYMLTRVITTLEFEFTDGKSKLTPIKTELLTSPPFKCIQSLYKSTYNSNAFTKGRKYYIVEEDSEQYWVQNDEQLKISFSKVKGTGGYLFDEYLKSI